MDEQMVKQMLPERGVQSEAKSQQNASSPSSRPTTTTNSGSARPAGFRNARENPGQPDAPEDDRWLVGYRINRMNSTVLLGGFNPALTETFKSKRWATLVRGEGWVIPLRYLQHVERLLFGAAVDLFDVDGAPTPVQRERDSADDRTATARVLHEIREAEQVALTPAETHARAAAIRAELRARRPEPADTDGDAG